MTDSLPTNIINNTFTVADLSRRADLLQSFFEHSFFVAEKPAADRVEAFRAYCKGAASGIEPHDVEAITAWGAELFDSLDAKNLYERIRALKQAGESLPRLTLYVPVHFGAQQIERLGSWCRANVRPELMLDIKVDPKTVGGCAFALDSAFHDFSFDYFAQKERSALVKLVHDYAE